MPGRPRHRVGGVEKSKGRAITGERGCRACGGPMWGRGPAATSPASRSRGRRRMPGLCCDLGGFVGSKPGISFSVHKNHRREEEARNSSLRIKICDITWSLRDHLKEFHYGYIEAKGERKK